MSKIIAKTIQLGDSVDPSKNFVLSIPSTPDGTLTISRHNGTPVVTVDAVGRVRFPGNRFPAFAAEITKATIGTGTRSIICSTETLDTDACYDPATGRFTPNVAGLYWITFMCSVDGVTLTRSYADIIKNVSTDTHSRLTDASPLGGTGEAAASAIVYMNGSTDYVFPQFYSAGLSLTSLSFNAFFSGVLVRPA